MMNVVIDTNLLLSQKWLVRNSTTIRCADSYCLLVAGISHLDYVAVHLYTSTISARHLITRSDSICTIVFHNIVAIRCTHIADFETNSVSSTVRIVNNGVPIDEGSDTIHVEVNAISH